MNKSHTYVMTTPRLDIACTIGVLSWYNYNPSSEHMTALKCMFRNLNSTKDWRLHFGGALQELALGGEGGGTFRCNLDSVYAGSTDNNKLTCGQVITFGGAVDWQSRIQKLTAQSTTDAEYYAIGAGCMRLSLISHLL